MFLPFYLDSGKNISICSNILETNKSYQSINLILKLAKKFSWKKNSVAKYTENELSTRFMYHVQTFTSVIAICISIGM